MFVCFLAFCLSCYPHFSSVEHYPSLINPPFYFNSGVCLNSFFALSHEFSLGARPEFSLLRGICPVLQLFSNKSSVFLYPTSHQKHSHISVSFFVIADIKRSSEKGREVVEMKREAEVATGYQLGVCVPALSNDKPCQTRT